MRFTSLVLPVLLLTSAFAAVVVPEGGAEVHILESEPHGREGGDTFDITIFHVNDVHAHLDRFRASGDNCTDPTLGCFGGYPSVKATIDYLRPQKENTLFLNIGDEFQGTLYFSYYGGEKIADTINQLGFDAFVLGNHEFDRGDDFLAEFLQNISFPTVCANIQSNNTNLMKHIQPYKIFKEYDLAVIGLTTETTPGISSPGPGTKFLNVTETMQKTVDFIRENKLAKRIVAMTHIGYAEDMKLAQNTRGLYLIIGGHSHTPLGNFTGAQGPYPTIEKNLDGEEVFVVTAYKWSEYLGALDISFDAEGRILKFTGAPIHMTNTTAVDTKLQTEIREWAAPFLEFSEQVVGNTTVLLDQTTCQQGECNIGDIVSDAVQWYRGSNTDAVITNSGGYRASINAGDIKLGQVFTTMPFQNSVVDLTFTGADLWKSFEGIASKVSQFNGQVVTSFVQVSKNIKFKYNPAAAVGSRLVELSINGKPLSASDTTTYKISTWDFLATGGDNFWPKQTNFITLNTQDEVFVAYLKQYSPIAPQLDGRISTV